MSTKLEMWVDSCIQNLKRFETRRSSMSQAEQLSYISQQYVALTRVKRIITTNMHVVGCSHRPN